MPLVRNMALALAITLTAWQAEAQVRFPDQSQLEMLNEARRALEKDRPSTDVSTATPSSEPAAPRADPEAPANSAGPPAPVAHNDVAAQPSAASDRGPMPPNQPAAPAQSETQAEAATPPQKPETEAPTTPAPVVAMPAGTSVRPPPFATTPAGPSATEVSEGHPAAAERAPAGVKPPSGTVVAPPPIPVSAVAVMPPPEKKPKARAHCANPDAALGVARIIEIDTAGGPIFGRVTRYVSEDSFLKPKEVVLTFDDGPAPAVTGPVLDTLDRFCTKATFFQVGKMALAHPRMAREVVARGHTVGSHTWSHPRGFNKLPLAVAKDEVERGFAAIALAVGQHVAPFFRFPGLGDGAPSLRYLKSRGIGTFSVDVVSEDSFIASSERLAATVLARVEQRQRGIILFHDIKPQTARALPIVLQELKKRGYRVVHLKARQMLQPEPAVLASLRSSYAHAKAIASNRKAEDIGAVAIYGSESGAAPPVTILAPPQRQLTRTGSRHASGNAKSSGRADGRERAKPVRAKGGEGWATTVHRPPAGEASP